MQGADQLKNYPESYDSAPRLYSALSCCSDVIILTNFPKTNPTPKPNHNPNPNHNRLKREKKDYSRITTF